MQKLCTADPRSQNCSMSLSASTTYNILYYIVTIWLILLVK